MESRGRESNYAWLRAVTALALITISAVGMYGVVVALKPVGMEFGASRAVASVPYAATMLGFGFGGLLMGRWADRKGVFPPSILGVVALPLGFLAASQAQAIWQFAAAQGLLIGLLGASAFFAPLIADTTHWFDRRRGRAVALVISGTYLAGAVWPPIVQHFIDAVGWRQTYLGLGLFCFATMTPLCLVLRPRLPATTATGTGGLDHGPRRLPDPGILQGLLCCAGIGCCVAMSMPQVHIVPLVTDLGHAAQRGAEMLSLMLGCGIISRLGSGWISERIGGLDTLLLGSALQALALILFMGVDGLTALYVMSALFGLSQGGIVPSYTLIVRRFFPESEAGRRIAAVLLATMAGMALGGWLAGLIYDLTGSYRWAFINAVAFNILNMAIAAWLRLRAGRPQPMPV